MENQVGVYKPMMASIQRITALKPIAGADRIECATVLGYQTVVNKGAFQEGDLCVWHAPDTIVDRTNLVYALLAKSDFVLDIVKIKKQVSEGLALPISSFETQLANVNLVEGTDVSVEVKILHYTKPAPLTEAESAAGGEFPSFLKKTDQPNLCSQPKLLRELPKDAELVFTKKMDGTSATYFWNEGVFGICSRNRTLPPTSQAGKQSVYQTCEKYYRIGERLQRLGKNLALQGEICGPAVQANPLGLAKLEYFVFHVWDINTQKMLNYDEMLQVVKDLNCVALSEKLHRNLQTVECFFRGPLGERTIDELVKWADLLKYENGHFAEGMVIFPAVELHSEKLEDRWSVKVLSKNFRLALLQRKKNKNLKAPQTPVVS